MSFWTSLRDAVEGVASDVGNYFLPGSSLITTPLLSKGAQEFQQSPLGMLGQIGSGVAGGMQGNASNWENLYNAATGAPSATSGWTSAEGGTGYSGGMATDATFDPLSSSMASGVEASGTPTSTNPLMQWGSDLWNGASNLFNGGTQGAATGAATKGATSWLGPLMSGASGIYGMTLADQLRKQALLAQKTANPWGTGGGQQLAQQQLMDVMSGGSDAYMKTPAFQARMRAAAATSAQTPGGPEAVQAAMAGGAGYNDWINQQAMLAGAPGSPVGAAQVGLQGTAAANTLASSSLGSIGYGVTQATGGNAAIPPAVRQWMLSQGMVV